MTHFPERYPALKSQIRRLIGYKIELIWVSGTDLDPIRGEVEWIESAMLELALHARAAMPYGGRLLIDSANVELSEPMTANPPLPCGRFVMIEFTCVRTSPEESIWNAPDMTRMQETMFSDQANLDRVRQLLSENGGAVYKYSEPGRAVTLRAYFPSALEILYNDGINQMTPETKNTILLVEDEGFVRNVACEILEAEGYTVLPARCGAEAIEIFHSSGPVHLLVTDVVMPGMNGCDLAQRLISHNPDLKTLYMSGYRENPASRMGLTEDSLEYIQKPFTFDSLTQKVRAVLDS